MGLKNVRAGARLQFGALLTGVEGKIRPIWKKLLVFELIYTVASILLSKLYYEVISSVCLSISGYTYLGPDNAIAVLLSPVSIIFTLLFLILVTILSIFGIGAMVFAFTTDKDFGISDMFYTGFGICKKCIYPKNYLIIPFLLFLLPLNGLLALASPISYVKIPGFIESFIINNNVLRIIYILALFLLTILIVTVIYSICYFVTDKDISFVEACKKSRALTKGKRAVSFFSIILFTIAADLIIIGFSSGVSKIATEVISCFSSSESSSMDISAFNNVINVIEALLRGSVLPVLNCCAVSVLYIRFSKEKQEPIACASPVERAKKINTKTYVILAIIIVLAIGADIYAFRNVYSEMLNEQTIPEIVAHRGDSALAPENTMPAFELALEEGVDCIELDIHQTKDGVIMISHDDNLLRVSGKDVCMHELTYEEAMQLEVGSWFSPKYEGTHFSTLAELLDKVEPTDTDLQIEIKPTGYEDRLEEQLLDLLNEKNMHDRVTVICLKNEPLIKLKKLDPTLKTAFCMFIAGSSIEDIEFSDDFSIEETNATAELIVNIHKAGKKCYVWTINSEENLQNLIDMGVDGIVTDNPIKMFNALLQADYSGGIKRLFSLIFRRSM